MRSDLRYLRLLLLKVLLHFLVPCMLASSKTEDVMGTAVGKAAERSEAGFPTAAGDRSIVSRSHKTVTKQDRRRLCGTSPNSRQSRRSPSSSHPQGWDISMEGSITSFVGIDVSK